MSVPAYLSHAKTWEGVREVPGAKSNPLITALWKTEAWLGNDDSEVPWCGLVMREWMRASGYPWPLAAYRARSWASWGVPLLLPCVGSVAVLSRPGGDHVGIVVGQNADGLVAIFGGNQNDSVRVSYFERKRITAIRWASEEPRPDMLAGLPVLRRGLLSTSEA